MQRLIPRGSPYAAVRSRLERLGFTCGERAGEFYGDDFQRAWLKIANALGARP